MKVNIPITIYSDYNFEPNKEFLTYLKKYCKSLLKVYTPALTRGDNQIRKALLMISNFEKDDVNNYLKKYVNNEAAPGAFYNRIQNIIIESIQGYIREKAGKSLEKIGFNSLINSDIQYSVIQDD